MENLQKLDLCYVSDLIDGLIKLFLNKNIISPVNLGNPNETSIVLLAKKIIKLTESKSKIIYTKAVR